MMCPPVDAGAGSFYLRAGKTGPAFATLTCPDCSKVIGEALGGWSRNRRRKCKTEVTFRVDRDGGVTVMSKRKVG